MPRRIKYSNKEYRPILAGEPVHGRTVEEGKGESILSRMES
jgi:hypothetical protein